MNSEDFVDCNKSGKDTNLCSTLFPHRHCEGNETEVGIIATGAMKEIGGCWNVILDDSPFCEDCTNEANGIRIHDGGGIIRESRTGMNGYNHSESFRELLPAKSPNWATRVEDDELDEEP